MLLSKLIAAAGEEVLEARGECTIGSLSMDSRAKMENGLFFCGANAGQKRRLTTVREEIEQIVREWRTIG